MFPEWPYVKKLSLSYLSDEGNNKIAALDIPVSLSSNFDEEDKVLYWLFKRDFTDVRLYNLTKDEEVTRYGIAGILPQSGKVIVIGKFPHISSHDEILMYYGNRNAGNITSPELNVPMQPLEDECCICYYMLDGKGYPDSVVEVLWKNNGYWEGNYQYADVGNTKFAVGNTDGVPVVNFPNQFTDNNTLPFSITYCVTEFPSDQKWMGCIPKYDNDITFYMEGNTFIIATASETLVNMPISELTSGQFQFVYIGVGKDTAEYRVYDVNKQLIGQGTVSANMTQTLTYQTTCLAGGYYDLNQSSCVKTGTAVVGRFRLFQRLLSQSETDILVDKDHYDNDYAYIDLRVDPTTMSIFNHETVSFGGMIENPYNSLESLDEDNICVTLFDPGRVDSSSDTGVIISHKCLGDDNFSIQAGGWTIYNISGVNPDCKRFPFYTVYTSSSTRWLPGHRYVVGYSVPAIATHLKFGSYDESINFKKTAGVNVNGAHLEPVEYENIIDPNHTSTTTEIYIDYNKIELQEGDLLKTDNDEYFQVQSISHDGNSYVVIPDHTLDNPPNEVYFIGHRAIGYRASVNKQKVIDSISVSEQTQDIINSNVPSTTHKIYINNSLIDVKPGDVFNADNNELFEVAVVDNDGNVAHADNVRTVACGTWHTVIIRDNNSVWVTGANGWGQLGLGDTNSRSQFTDTGMTAKCIACGKLHTVIIKDDGSVWSTGQNNHGQLGLGDTTWRTRFTNTGITAKFVACGDDHTVIIKDDDSVWVTGCNEHGQLGLGDTNDRHEFTDTGITAKFVACGGSHTVIIRGDNLIWSTGWNNSGQLGLGDTNDRNQFTDTGITAKCVACGAYYTIIIKDDGSVWVTGANSSGQLGLGDTSNRNQFTDTGMTAKFVACGYNHTVMIRDDGSVWVTGDNSSGQLGLGDTNRRTQFTDTGMTARFVACGSEHTVIIREDGFVWGTGANGYGQLGLGDTSSRYQFTNTGVTAKQVACGDEHTVIIKENGSVWGTGYNYHGQLGLGDTNNRNQFTNTGLTARSIACGSDHTVIIREDNSVWTTGDNSSGQLGLGDTSNRYRFTNTGIIAKQVACGEEHTIIVKKDNSIWVTGYNYHGELGLGDMNDRNQFTNTGITAKFIACGDWHTVIIREDNSIWSTGWNGWSQLGLGDTNNRNQFTDTGIVICEVVP